MNIFRRHGLEDVLSDLREEFDNICRDRDRYKKQVEEWSKDEEIQKAKQFAERCLRHSLLQLSELEMQKCVAFKKQHYESCENGSTYQYEITHTGIGTILKIKCPVCGTEEGVKDVDVW